MKNTWFTSDTHFGHRPIIKYCNRPFESSTDMDIEMIERWNAVVRPNDTIYHLGDFTMHKTKDIVDEILAALNGKKILITGNHDSNFVKNHPAWHEVHQYLEIKGPDREYWLTMFHYPIGSWNGAYHNSWHLHGHSHGTFDSGSWGNGKKKLALDVGVDSHQFTPWSFDEIREYMRTISD